MPVIIAQEVGQNYQLFCEDCKIPLSIVEPETLRGLYPDYCPVLCFDCDGNADVVPPHIYSDEVPYLLTIDGKTLVVNPWSTARGHAERASYWKAKLSEWMHRLNPVKGKARDDTTASHVGYALSSKPKHNNCGKTPC